MKFIFLLALKNIARQKRRTILTSLVICIAITFFIVVSSLLKGFYETSFENELNFNTAHLKIRSINYDEDKPNSIENLIYNYREIEGKLRKIVFFKGLTDILSFNAEIDNFIDSRFVIVIGADMKTIDSVFVFKKFVKGDISGIVIGEEIMKEMNLEVGNSVFLTFRRKGDMIESIEFIVSGVISSPNPIVNNSYVYIDIEKAKEIIGVDGITEIAVKTEDYNEIKKYWKILSSEMKEVRIYTWEELAKDFLSMAQAKANGNGFIIFFIAIIGFVGVINTTMISVYEKRREIGTLKTLGMKEKEILLLFLIECFFIGFIGSISGLIIGVISSLYFVIHGIDFFSQTGLNNLNLGYKVLGIVKSRWDIPSIILVIALSILFTTFAGYYPARKGAKMEPAESLRVIQ